MPIWLNRIYLHPKKQISVPYPKLSMLFINERDNDIAQKMRKYGITYYRQDNEPIVNIIMAAIACPKFRRRGWTSE